MRNRFHAIKRAGLLAVIVVLSVVSLSLVLHGCGGGGYDAPVTIQTSSALISPETLKEWIDSGRVNGTGFDRVIVMDVNSQSNYAAGHIPGAQFVDSADIYQTRNEGVAADVNMVLDGSHMDSLLHKYGIDRNTTIVFTSGNSDPKGTPGASLSATRAYWTFRYWGFPRERLKVVDGINPAWAAQFGLTTAAAPTIVPSTFSVKNNGILKSDLRLSLSEMITIADAGSPNGVIIDGRGAGGSFGGNPGSTAGVFAPSGDFVAFEGKIKGAQALSFTSLYDSANGNRFFPRDQLIAKFAAVGLDSSKTAYVHCRTGVIASSLFFVLDGVLGWPVANYDASWSQWGQMAGDPTNGKQIDPNSPWRTDIPSRTEGIVYNILSGKTIEKLCLDGSAATCAPPASFDTDGNKIEEEDVQYMNSGGAGGSAGTSGGGRTGC
ncbi:MAG: selenite/tellurite reduction operon rhodanese-like protein ExtH [Thermodesulfovibrionales bacterium]